MTTTDPGPTRLAAYIRDQLDDEQGCDQTDHSALAACLLDVLDELERITSGSSDPDARMHATAAMANLASIWLDEDQLGAKLTELGLDQ